MKRFECYQPPAAPDFYELGRQLVNREAPQYSPSAWGVVFEDGMTILRWGPRGLGVFETPGEALVVAQVQFGNISTQWLDGEPG